MFAYAETKLENVQNMFEDYIKTLTGVYDNYLEQRILNGVFYVMTYKKKEIGYFTLWTKEKITQFYIKDDYKYLAQASFKTIIDDFKINSAYVPTCDTFLLSLAMDFHKKIELKAYFFKESTKEIEAASYPKSMLRLGNLSDAEEIKRLSHNFFDDLYQAISDRLIYILEDEVIYGFGVIVQNKIHKNHKSIGMFTVEAHRHKGVGRSIVLHLKDLVHTMGFKTLPGCWYHDFQSKRTLESCGYLTDGRLLKITF